MKHADKIGILFGAWLRQAESDIDTWDSGFHRKILNPVFGTSEGKASDQQLADLIDQSVKNAQSCAASLRLRRLGCMIDDLLSCTSRRTAAHGPNTTDCSPARPMPVLRGAFMIHPISRRDFARQTDLGVRREPRHVFSSRFLAAGKSTLFRISR